MKMSCKTLAWSVLSCAALWSTAAQASPISLSFSGTIRSGYDTLGEFGNANADLAGLAVEVRYGFDSALFGTNWNSGEHTLTQTVTVAGVSKQYTLEPWNSWSQSYISNALTLYGNQYNYYWYGNYDQIYQYSGGNLAGGGYLETYQYAYSNANPMGLPTDATASMTYLTQVNDYSDGNFYRYDASWNATYFNNSVDRIVLNADQAVAAAALRGNDVPEPGTLALAGLALAGVLLTRRALQVR